MSEPDELVREALVMAGAANAWQNFGDCRAFGHTGAIPQPAEVDVALRSAIAALDSMSEAAR
jgi:hypothetical protein